MSITSIRRTPGEEREARFVDHSIYLHILREEAAREADRERRWRSVKRWAKRGVLFLAAIGLVYLGVWASLR